MEKIAIITDSCGDIPTKLIEELGIYILPLKVIYPNGDEYLDGVNLTPQQVYDQMPELVPSTSLPDGQAITDILDKVKNDGYTEAIFVTISSGLSGTHNLIRLISSDYEGLNVDVVDSLNISYGSGVHAVKAAEYVKQGFTKEEVLTKISNNIKNSKVFFVIETLDYLRKGGRIGLVSAVVGSAFNIKPIISCNEEGVYYNVAKARGRKASIQKTLDLALDYIKDCKSCKLAICSGGAKEEAAKLKDKVLASATNYSSIHEFDLSPVLGVHTGPGLVGIAVLIEED